jgi:hypothetical protein
MQKKKKALFLYSELAGYFLACLKALQRHGVEIHVIRFPVNPEAPFEFEIPEGIKVYDRKSFNRPALLARVAEIEPDFVYCSGWLDKDYLLACTTFRKRIPVVLALDNPWKGTIKQQLSRFAGPMLKRVFTHCWVPGKRQEAFALRLGFTHENILHGVYSADSNLYSGYYDEVKDQKEKAWPHRFLFTGRYIES